MKIKHVQNTATVNKKLVPTDILSFADTSQKKDIVGLVKIMLTSTNMK